MEITVIDIDEKKLFAGAKVREKLTGKIFTIFVVPDGKRLIDCIEDGSYVLNKHYPFNQVMFEKENFELVESDSYKEYKKVGDTKIYLTGRKYKHTHTQRIKEAMIPDPELGLYQSLMMLQKEGYLVDNFMSLETAILNPNLFDEVID